MRTRQHKQSVVRRHARRAGVVVQVAVMSTIIMGFGALAVDVGMLYTTKADMQMAADAAALAAAGQLAGKDQGDPEELARAAAETWAEKHIVFGSQVVLDRNADVEMGRAELDQASGKFYFDPSAGAGVNAVRVTVRRTEDWEDNIPLMFANIFGTSSKQMWAKAAAVLIPRDISVVIDLSGSMNYDSQLRKWSRSDGGFVNTRDVWCALDGPSPSKPYEPGAPWETEYAGDTGPTYGQMTEWGDYLVPGQYDVTQDEGLVYLPRRQTWGPKAVDPETGYVAPFLNYKTVLEAWPESRADTMLSNQGYDVWERWAILTNEVHGYLTPAQVDGIGFNSRVIWHEDAAEGFDRLTVYLGSDDDAGTPSLSHLVVTLPSAALFTALTSAESQGNYMVEVVDPDPQSGAVGIKWDETELGENGVAETEWFSVLVPSNLMSETNVICKAGPGYSGVNHLFEQVDSGNKTRWRLRVATVLGLASQWSSGMNGSGGDGDGMIEGEDEIAWLDLPEYRVNWNWKSYINHNPSSSTFGYYFGLKTYTDFLLQSRASFHQTDNLWQTPAMPVQQTKDAVWKMVEVIEGLDSLDRISLEVYDTIGRPEVALLPNPEFHLVEQTLYQRQAAHYDRYTNIGDGLARANERLDASDRPASAKVIVLMSDGNPNRNDGDPEGRSPTDYALAMADEAGENNYRIYSISVGLGVNRWLMQEIAERGNGEEYYADGTPEEIQEKLEEIFMTLGGKRPVALIE